MCCDGTLEPPDAHHAELAGYRKLLMEGGSWGEPGWLNELPRYSAYVDTRLLLTTAQKRAGRVGDVVEFEEVLDVDWHCVARDVLDNQLPVGLVVVQVRTDGPRVLVSRPIVAVAEGSVQIDVLVDSRVSTPVEVCANEVSQCIDPGSARWLWLSVDTADPAACISVDGTPVDLAPIIVRQPAVALQLSSETVVRWSVIDDSGAAWFPTGALRKWDLHGRPFFHAAHSALSVPPGELVVRAARGMEYRSTEQRVSIVPGETAKVRLVPARRLDPAASGWYGADLHCHMNYAGDHVVSMADAARMQEGEALHVLNLVAGNLFTTRVYDRAALEKWVGRDLPWSDSLRFARMGVEYRNDLLGHFHAFGISRAPTHYANGHLAGDEPCDWPPVAIAAQSLHGDDAIVGYCHPVAEKHDDEDTPDSFFAATIRRTVEARESVVDAALGLVDSIDLVSPNDPFGAAVLYRRLLGTGLRIAATAGTDTFLSWGRSSIYSGPPGWGRVYAHVEGSLTASSFKQAVRRQRTIATNGPWLSLDVAGHGVGARISANRSGRLPVTAVVDGPGVMTLEILTSKGRLEAIDVVDGRATLTAELHADESDFVVAMAHGPCHTDVLDRQVFAHTSPVYIDVGGAPVRNPDDLMWCLRWIDLFEDLVRTAGRFSDESQFADFAALCNRARAFYRSAA
jgi:hypothetical protein